MPKIHYLKIPSNAKIMLKGETYYAIVITPDSITLNPTRIAYIIFWYLHEETAAKNLLSKYLSPTQENI